MYRVEFTKQAAKELQKLDRLTRHMIYVWIEKNLDSCSDPYAHGKALKGSLCGYWRYRIGNYRLICEIKDDELIILALKIGHRREIYRKA